MSFKFYGVCVEFVFETYFLTQFWTKKSTKVHKIK